jgi:hypothetical protein
MATVFGAIEAIMMLVELRWIRTENQLVSSKSEYGFNPAIGMAVIFFIIYFMGFAALGAALEN